MSNHLQAVKKLLGSMSLADVAAGRIQGVTLRTLRGRNEDFDTGGTEAIWLAGGAYTGQPTAFAETIEVLSGSGNDADEGSGATAVTVLYLDANHALQTEVLTMAGATPVPTAVNGARIIDWWVSAVGSTGSNEGLLTLRHTTTTTNIFSTIPIGYNRPAVAAYTTPAGKTSVLVDWSVAASRTAAASYSSCRLLRRPSGAGYMIEDVIDAPGTGGTVKNDIMLPLAAQDDIYVLGQVTSADNAFVSSVLRVLEVDDAVLSL